MSETKNETLSLRKRKTKDPCKVCGLHMLRCICSEIPLIEVPSKLALVIHHRELKRTTNTGQLAIKALKNSTMVIRGQEGEPLDLSYLLSEAYESYILFPSEGALPIEELRPKKPVQLFVADGNWRQASKMHLRQKELSHLPHVCIRQKNSSMVHLRQEHFSEGYSTLEAIAMAFGALEGDEVKAKLMSLYQAKLRATLAGRGIVISNKP